MPTGYTHNVQTGEITTLKEYALQCARAFGACVTLRDEAIPSEIPHFEPDTKFYDEKLIEAEKLRDFLWRDYSENPEVESQLKEKYSEYCNKIKASNIRYLEQDSITLNNYNSMLSKVIAWDAPTQDHKNLKDFMIKQLKESIQFDVYGLDALQEPKSFEKWLDDERNYVLEDTARYKKEIAGEIERVSQRNLWISKLVESLEGAN